MTVLAGLEDRPAEERGTFDDLSSYQNRRWFK